MSVKITMDQVRALNDFCLNRLVFVLSNKAQRGIVGMSWIDHQCNESPIRPERLEWDLSSWDLRCSTPNYCGDPNAAWELGNDLYLNAVKFADEKSVVATISQNENPGDLLFYSEKAIILSRAIVLAWVAMRLEMMYGAWRKTRT